MFSCGGRSWNIRPANLNRRKVNMILSVEAVERKQYLSLKGARWIVGVLPKEWRMIDVAIDKLRFNL